MASKYVDPAYGQHGAAAAASSDIPVGMPLLTSTEQQQQVPYAYEVVEPMKPSHAQEQPHETKYKDTWAALLFVAMFAAVSYVGLTRGVTLAKHATLSPTPAPAAPSLTGTQLHRLLAIGAALVAMAGALSLGWLLVMLRLAESMVRVTLQLTVVMYGGIALVLYAKGAQLPAVVCALLCVITMCYYYCVRSRIPFAGANLAVACAATRAHRGTIGVAFLSMVLQFGWMMLWSACTLAVYDSHSDDKPVCTIDPSTKTKTCGRKIAWGPYFGLLVAFYWGLQVFRNISHTTTAGAVGSWWFLPQQLAGVVGGALRRACTWSFGSICFGSLLVSILRALEQLANGARGRDGEQNAVACIMQCILECIRSLLEWLNRWAFTYVGIYGYSFSVAGKAVFELFGARGWSLIINDSLIENTLSLVALMNGALCAGIGAALVTAEKTTFAGGVGGNTLQQAQIAIAVVGFLIGLAMCTVVMSVVESAVCTVFVCFAADPNALRVSRPMVHHRLMEAYCLIHRDVLVQCGYMRHQ